MKELKVDVNSCIGCGLCANIDQEHFEIGADGLSKVISQENLDNPEVQNVVDSCPVGAIKLEEKEN